MTMYDMPSARVRLVTAEAAELQRRRDNGDPNAMSIADMHALPGSGPLVLDGHRQRPRYFDGRFLTGADLTRDQEYVRQRQADLARASGTGVMSGLQVSAAGDVLTITAGHGITPSGDLVVVSGTRNIAIADLAATQRLDAHLGLRLQPAQPLARRTGLFILALRPVEFTANQISAYPTTLNGPRVLEDSDIVEATAITLIPYPETGGAGSLDDMRRAVARLIFVEGSTNGQPQDALPLAMLALDRGGIRWIDVAMVRRETGADTPLQVALGGRPRALAEAHVLQHEQHLADVLQTRGGRPFPAAEAFGALPAAGRLPLAAIATDSLGFLQAFFPGLVDVDISFVASDEIAALVEESLALPPIDLMGHPADLDATGVVVLAPVKRDVLAKIVETFGKTTAPVRNLEAGFGLRRPPMDMLSQMIARRPPAINAVAASLVPTASGPTAEQWKTAWNEAVTKMEDQRDGQPKLLWYVRRRSVAYRSRLEGVAVAVEAKLSSAHRRIYLEWGLGETLDKIEARAEPAAMAKLDEVISKSRAGRSAVVASGLLATLSAMGAGGIIGAEDVEKAADAFKESDAGRGYERLLAAAGKDGFDDKVWPWLAGKELTAKFDKALRGMEPRRLIEVAEKLIDALEHNAADEFEALLA
jgi:hypothetical protein